MKLWITRLIQIFGVAAPAVAIYAWLALLGQLGHVVLYTYDGFFGHGRALPLITNWAFLITLYSPIPLHWIGLAIMLVLLSVAYAVNRTASSPESASKRLLILTTVEWSVLCLFLAIIALGTAAPFFPPAFGEKFDMAVVPRFIEIISKSGYAVIYGGLPRPELKEFEIEKSAHSTVNLHGFYFYKDPVNLSQEDDAILQSLITSTPPFERMGPRIKQCFSYHPDFAFQWHDSTGHNYDMLICFGCGEAKLYGPDLQLYCDVRGPSYKSLKAILLKYSEKSPTITP